MTFLAHSSPSLVAMRRSRQRGFTVVESIIALAVCVMAMTVMYASAAQSIRIIRSAREQAAASQLLELRFQRLRNSSTWNQLLAPSTARTWLSGDTRTATELSNPTETYVIAGYPSATSSYTLTRAADGSWTQLGSAFGAAQSSLQITGRIAWGAQGSSQRQRTQTTIITKGGL